MKKYEVKEAIKLKKQSHLMIDASLAKLWISARAFTFAVPGSMARPCTMGWKQWVVENRLFGKLSVCEASYTNVRYWQAVLLVHSNYPACLT